MTDKNIRFREPQLPDRLSRVRWYDGVFEYAGFIYAFFRGPDSSSRKLHVARLHRHFVVGSGVCNWAWDGVDGFDEDHPEIFLVLQIWSQGGYGEMSLVEFLNAAVSE